MPHEPYARARQHHTIAPCILTHCCCCTRYCSSPRRQVLLLVVPEFPQAQRLSVTVRVEGRYIAVLVSDTQQGPMPHEPRVLSRATLDHRMVHHHVLLLHQYYWLYPLCYLLGGCPLIIVVVCFPRPSSLNFIRKYKYIVVNLLLIKMILTFTYTMGYTHSPVGVPTFICGIVVRDTPP